MLQPIIPMFTDERKSFYYTIENIIEDKTKTLSSGISCYSSHLDQPYIVFTYSFSSHNFFP